ncbi:MAG: hypothetical protein HYW48_06000 [Deltaproteobacteria bacterium]|nr:hypothetical protein [Deltaproteobacteria bacterium]
MLLSIVCGTFSSLRRGPVFLPVLFFGALISLFASLASSWGVAEFRKILFDVGSFGFHIAGNIVAMVWAAQTLAVARQDGTLEIQLASPVPRPLWITGRFLGLALAIIVLGCSMLAIWQASLLVTGFGWMTGAELAAFTLQGVGWLVVASMGLFFASFCGLVTTLFSSIAVFLAGLLTELVAETILSEGGAILAKIFQWFKTFWNLQHFNRTPTFLEAHGSEYFLSGLAYGGFLIAFFLTAASLIFSRREAVF